ncbi:phage tail tube protein [Acinetobacter radioresistens]|uniref:phage tail tube protein n=1 Tax=Acinetobacter radioresistens TaxID=40216 RepID=UPI0032124643
MAIRTQGTSIFISDGTTITELGCITALDFGSDSVSRIDNTCLQETKSKAYISGLSDPGEGSITFNVDEEDASHLKLLEWADDRTELTFYIGASGSTDKPTISTGTVSVPTTRSFWTFQGNLANSTPSIEQDSLVSYQVSMQRSSAVTFIPKTA